MSLAIEVSAEDIKNGYASNYHMCPVALSIGRSCPSAHHITVTAGGISVFYPDGQFSDYSVSRGLRRFILQFDDGMCVEPARFRLRERS